MQQSRNQTHAAAIAAERRFQQSSSRGKPAHARASHALPRFAESHNSAATQETADRGSSRILTSVRFGKCDEDGAWQDQSFDDCTAGGEALSRIAQVRV